MRKKKAEQLALPFGEPAPAPPRAPGLWEAVDALPEKAARYHRARRKPVKPRLYQATLLELEEEASGDE